MKTRMEIALLLGLVSQFAEFADCEKLISKTLELTFTDKERLKIHELMSVVEPTNDEVLIMVRDIVVYLARNLLRFGEL